MQDFFPTVWHYDMKIAEMEMLLWFFFVGHEYIYVKNHIICQNKCKQYKAKKKKQRWIFFYLMCNCNVYAALKSNTYPTTLVPAIIIFT